MNRLPLLDVTRWFAAIFVVMFHYIYMIDHIREGYPLLKSISNYGYLAVQLFFIISGYVIFMSVDNNKNPFRFVKSRFIRLYPAYIFSVLITFVFIYLNDSLNGYHISDFVGNLTMIPDILGFHPANAAYWSLAIEILFYTMIATTLFITSDVNKIFNILVIWFLLSVANLAYPIGLLQKVLALKYASLFVGGAGIYLYMKTKKIYPLLISALTAPFSVIYAIMHSRKLEGLFPYFSFSSFIVATLVIAFYVWIFFAVSRQNIKLAISANIISLMAGSSYVLYLIHETIGKWVIRAYPELGESLVFIIIFIMVIMSAAVTRFFEAPAIGVLKNFIYGSAKNKATA